MNYTTFYIIIAAKTPAASATTPPPSLLAAPVYSAGILLVGLGIPMVPLGAEVPLPPDTSSKFAQVILVVLPV